MKRSRIHVLAATLLMILLGLGCDKAAHEKTATASDPAAATPKSDTIAHFHWLGKKRLAGETNAVAFLKIWNLPESARLEAQTLDKLATAPWRLLRHETNQPSTPNPQLLLRPLLDDLVQEESYMEIHGITNGPGDMVLAVRLPADRAALWQTNLPVVMKALGAKAGGGKAKSGKAEKRETGAELAVTGNWKLGTWNVTSTRSGDWTLLTFDLEPGSGNAPNALVGAMVKRIQTSGVPFAASPTNYWVDLGANLPRVAQAFARGWNLPANFPQVWLTMVGEGGNVRTRGVLDFPQPLNLELEPWNVPTNLIHTPLTSFTAMRGIGHELASLPAWRSLDIGSAPDQFFVWAQEGLPMSTYFAAPMTGASNTIARLTDVVVQKSRGISASNDLFGFERATDGNGIRWTGLPYVSTYVRSETLAGQPFIAGGFLPKEKGASSGLFPEVAKDIFGRANLVYYDWEITGARVESLLYLGQFWRAVTQKAQLPADSIGVAWLKALFNQPGASLTMMEVMAPHQLSFDRKSVAGLTGLELHLLMDWLESPEFPAGVYTLISTNASLPSLN